LDFLRIRNEARQRATSAADEGAAKGSPATPAEPRVPGVVREDGDALGGELAARLQGPAPAAPASAGGFTTWRPGSGAAPAVPLAPARPAAAGIPDPGVARPDGVTAPSAPPREPVDPLSGFFYSPDEAAPLAGELGELSGAAPAPDSEPETALREEYLTFLLGAEEYAVDIERVREVLKCPTVTEVPRAPAHVLGVVTVRGEVVAVFDPRRRLALPAAAAPAGSSRLVIVDAGDGPCGLLVDAIAGVVRLRPGSIEPCPQGIGGASQECLAGIGREGERLFTVLDLGALLRRAPAPAARRPGEGRVHGAA
jgi:purine-binding chemotaxis protein CheW